MCDAWNRLVQMSTFHLTKIFPSKHNSLLGGLYDRHCEIFALDLLLHHNIGGASFHRLNPETQEAMIGGIEELLFEDLPEGIYNFYEKKLAIEQE